jgi:hypothetical protein
MDLVVVTSSVLSRAGNEQSAQVATESGCRRRECNRCLWSPCALKALAARWPATAFEAKTIEDVESCGRNRSCHQ